MKKFFLAAVGLSMMASCSQPAAVENTEKGIRLAYVRIDSMQSQYNYFQELADELQAEEQQIVADLQRRQQTLQENIARVGAVGETGEAAQTVDALRQYATAYGVEYNPSWYQNAAKMVLGGQATLDTFQNEIKNIAKSKYVNYADLIDQGMSPADIA